MLLNSVRSAENHCMQGEREPQDCRVRAVKRACNFSPPDKLLSICDFWRTGYYCGGSWEFCISLGIWLLMVFGSWKTRSIIESDYAIKGSRWIGDETQWRKTQRLHLCQTKANIEMSASLASQIDTWHWRHPSDRRFLRVLNQEMPQSVLNQEKLSLIIHHTWQLCGWRIQNACSDVYTGRFIILIGLLTLFQHRTSGVWSTTVGFFLSIYRHDGVGKDRW